MRTRRKLSEEEIEGFKREKRINRRSTIVSLVAIIGFILLSLPILMNVPTPSSALKKADEQRTVPRLSLTAAYYAGEEKPAKPIADEVLPDKPIVFLLTSIRPVYVSLAAVINAGEPQVVFHRARIPPGPNRLVEKAGVPYVFTLTDEVKSARFCIIDASDFELLQQRASHIKREWSSVEEAACLDLR